MPGKHGETTMQILRRDIKLKLVKEAINRTLPQINRFINSRERPLTKPSTVLTDKVFNRLIKHVEAETKALKGVKDHNFQRLITSLRDILVYIAEEDSYYAVWLMTAMLVISDETVKFLKQPEVAKERSWCFTWFLNEMSPELFQLLNVESAVEA